MRKYALFILVSCVILAVAGCKSKKEKDPTEKRPLTAIKTEYMYTFPDDVKSRVEIRAGWIDMDTSGRNPVYRFSAGRLHLAGGRFTADDEGVKVVAVAPLVETLMKYVVEMPVGLVLTFNGALPYADRDRVDQPEEFVAFVREFQTALDRVGIQYTFIITDKWTTK